MKRAEKEDEYDRCIRETMSKVKMMIEKGTNKKKKGETNEL
jgi:hypothetical protein